MNVCETMGKFSFADSLRWGWGNTEGDGHGEVVICLGGKKILGIMAEILALCDKKHYIVHIQNCLYSQM